MNKITLVDYTNEHMYFYKYAGDIKRYINHIIDNNFDFDLTLKVIFRDKINDYNYINSEIAGGAMTYKYGTFYLCIAEHSLQNIEYDDGLDMAIILSHEMAHIYDLYHMMHNRYYTVEPLKRDKSNMTDYIISLGYNIWTEFYAYLTTFKQFYDLHNYPTKLQLVKKYERIIKDYEELKTKLNNLNEETHQKAEQFIKDIEILLYGCCKYLAGIIYGKGKYYKYTLKTQKNVNFIKFQKFIDGLLSVISPMITNSYGKGMAKKLYNIGMYVINKMYAQFNIYPFKHKKLIKLALFN